MSNTSSSDPDSERLFQDTSAGLAHAITHVFLSFPPEAQPHVEDNSSLVRAVCTAVRAYSGFVEDAVKTQWLSIANMLNNLESFVRCEDQESAGHAISQLREMQTGGVLLISPQTFPFLNLRRYSYVFPQK